VSKIEYVTPGIEDREVLFAIYACSRADEVNNFGWPADQRESFLRMQFSHREAAYRLQFPAAEIKLIRADRVIVGSVIVERRSSSFWLVDIALFLEARRKGIGSSVIGDLQEEAQILQVPILLHVDKFNAGAIRFYVRMGFQVIEESQINFTLIWSPTKEE
jgi:ribosomal protein S18 acetylase RimI-like enzyme